MLPLAEAGAGSVAPRTGLPQGAPLRGEGGIWDGWVARGGAEGGVLRQQLRVNSPPEASKAPGEQAAGIGVPALQNGRRGHPPMDADARGRGRPEDGAPTRGASAGRGREVGWLGGAGRGPSPAAQGELAPAPRRPPPGQWPQASEPIERLVRLRSIYQRVGTSGYTSPNSSPLQCRQSEAGPRRSRPSISPSLAFRINASE